jgi:hypothetical protein
MLVRAVATSIRSKIRADVRVDKMAKSDLHRFIPSLAFRRLNRATEEAAMGRRRVEQDMKTYGSMIANRMRELRDAKGWSIDEFRVKLAEHGIVGSDGRLIPKNTAYSYEVGKSHKGAALSVDHFPVIASIYGFSSPHAWLPDNWPAEGALAEVVLPRG